MTSFSFPDDLHYHATHFWLKPSNAPGEYQLGITQYGQKQLGKILFVDLPFPGTELVAGSPFGAVESSKVVFDLLSPVSGIVLESNAQLKETVGLLNDDCYGQGWMVRMRLASGSALVGMLTAEDYATRFSGNSQQPK